MTHTEALNLILAHACPAHYDRETEVSTFLLEVHCQVMEVKARLASTYGTIQYDILSVATN